MQTDPRAIRILAFWLDDETIREHDGAPPLSPHLLWGLFCSYTECFLAAADGLKPNIPPGAPTEGVTPLDALCAGRVLAEQLLASRWWIAAECRKQGYSWSEIGDALGMSKQAAWEGFQKYAAEPWLSSWPTLAREYRTLAEAPAD